MAFPGCHDNPVSSLNWHVHSGVAPNLGFGLQADKKTQRLGKSYLFYRLGRDANVEKMLKPSKAFTQAMVSLESPVPSPAIKNKDLLIKNRQRRGFLQCRCELDTSVWLFFCGLFAKLSLVPS